MKFLLRDSSSPINQIVQAHISVVQTDYDKSVSELTDKLNKQLSKLLKLRNEAVEENLALKDRISALESDLKGVQIDAQEELLLLRKKVKDGDKNLAGLTMKGLKQTKELALKTRVTTALQDRAGKLKAVAEKLQVTAKTQAAMLVTMQASIDSKEQELMTAQAALAAAQNQATEAQTGLAKVQEEAQLELKQVQATLASVREELSTQQKTSATATATAAVMEVAPPAPDLWALLQTLPGLIETAGQASDLSEAKQVYLTQLKAALSQQGPPPTAAEEQQLKQQKEGKTETETVAAAAAAAPSVFVDYKTERTFIAACFSDDAATASKLLATGLMPEVDKTTACLGLHEASENGSVSVIKVLLEAGVGLETRDETQHTPLMLACLYDQQDAIAVLIDHGANPDAQNADGATALMLALQEWLPPVVTALLRAQTQLNGIVDNKGKTAFDYAKDLPEEQKVVWEQQLAEYGYAS
jgi:hypothetical protein